MATLLMTGLLFLANNTAIFHRIAAGTGFLVMLAVAELLGKYKGNHSQATLLQSVHLVAFFVILMIFTYD